MEKSTEKFASMDHLKSLSVPYDVKEVVIEKDTTEIGPKLGLDVNQVLKTLVVKGTSGKFYMCAIGAAQRLKIKKLKRITNESNIQMANPDEIFEQTGFQVGGIPGFALKRPLETYLEISMQNFDIIAIGAGKRGVEILMTPADLQKASNGVFADIISLRL